MVTHGYSDLEQGTDDCYVADAEGCVCVCGCVCIPEWRAHLYACLCVSVCVLVCVCAMCVSFPHTPPLPPFSSAPVSSTALSFTETSRGKTQTERER